jgi:glucose uptake protein GlcU
LFLHPLIRIRKNSVEMKTARYVLIILATGIIIGQLTVIDFSNHGWKENAGSYLGIIAMIIIIIGMILSLVDLKRKNNER